jgi:hypothetical protein
MHEIQFSSVRPTETLRGPISAAGGTLHENAALLPRAWLYVVVVGIAVQWFNGLLLHQCAVRIGQKLVIPGGPTHLQGTCFFVAYLVYCIYGTRHHIPTYVRANVPCLLRGKGGLHP